MFLSIIQFDLHRNNETKGTQIYWFICVLLILITGFRDGLGGDTKNYVDLWNEMPDIFQMNQNFLDNTRYQPGFIYFFSFLKAISRNYVIVQIVHGIIINVTVFWIFKKYSKASFICVLIYFILNYFEYNMEIARESIAVALGLIAYDSYENNRWKPAILLSTLAFLMHISAIILLIMPLCTRIRYTKKTVFIFLSTIIAIYIIFPLLPDLTILVSLITSDSEHLIDRYDTREIDQAVTIFYFISLSIKCLVLPLCCIYILKDKADKVIGLAMVYLIFYSMSAFSYGFYRFSNYFAPFYIILLSMTIKEFSFRYLQAKYRPVFFVCFIFLFLYMYQSVQLQKDLMNGGYLYNRYIPYKSVLF